VTKKLLSDEELAQAMSGRGLVLTNQAPASVHLAVSVFFFYLFKLCLFIWFICLRSSF
jgi:hypothetical protein